MFKTIIVTVETIKTETTAKSRNSGKFFTKLESNEIFARLNL